MSKGVKGVKVTDILKENIHQRFVRSVNKFVRADDKSAFHLLDKDSTIPNIIFDKVENKDPKTILVIDDLTCEIAREFPNAEVTLALSSYRVPDIVYNKVKARIEKYFSDVKKSIKVVQLKEIYDMENKFDLIIANPPYSNGGHIAVSISENCNYDEFINLLPLGEYKTNKAYQHVDIVARGLKWNGDAKTRPFLGKMTKTATNNSWEEFVMHSALKDDNYKCLHKYIRKQISDLKNTLFVTNEVFFKSGETVKSNEFLANYFTSQDLVYSLRGKAYKKREDSVYYKANLLGEEFAPFDYTTKYGSCKNNKSFSSFVVRGFKTKEEKINFAKWWYSSELIGDGKPKHGLTSLLIASLEKGTSSSFAEILPIVDWTREWTDEEILKEYGYTDEEIKEVLDKAKHFKRII